MTIQSESRTPGPGNWRELAGTGGNWAPVNPEGAFTFTVNLRVFRALFIMNN